MSNVLFEDDIEEEGLYPQDYLSEEELENLRLGLEKAKDLSYLLYSTL